MEILSTTGWEAPYGKIKISGGAYGIERALFCILALIATAMGCASLSAERNYQKGSEAFRTGNMGQAYHYAIAANTELPENTKYKSLLGWIYIKQGKLDQARILFSAIHEANEEDVSGLQGLAWLDYMAGRWEAAGEKFQKQLKWARRWCDDSDFQRFEYSSREYIESCLSDAHYGLGLVNQAQGLYAEAEKHLLEALRFKNTFSGHTPIKIAAADALYAQGKYLKALRYYEEGLSDQPQADDKIIVNYVWCNYFSGLNDHAIEIIRKYQSSAKDPRPYEYALVFVRYAQHKILLAEKHLVGLIASDPNYADTDAVLELIYKTSGWKEMLTLFAKAYVAKGEFSRAYPKIRQYLAQRKQDCEVELLEAWCDLYLNRALIALSEFKAISARRECDAVQAMLGRGVSLLYLGLYDDAEKAFIMVQSREPHNIRAHVAIGALAYLKGDYDLAIKIYSSYLNQMPRKEPYFSWASHALNNLGWSYYRKGQYTSALETFKRLKTMHPQPIYYEVFNGLGWAYLKSDNKQAAREAFQQALVLVPQNTSALTGLAEIKATEKDPLPPK